ncbi:MAG: tyrosyl-tRNA synthetase, partial [Acidimicrobiaceae bacterium]|nr:tyrosyl-tRNA synthetase [Acidimicrobiaceae bacterium]
FADAPSTTVPREPIGLVDLLALTGVCGSKSDARRMVQQGGVYLNNRKQAEDGPVHPVADTLHGRYAVLRRGRKDHHLVRFE